MNKVVKNIIVMFIIVAVDLGLLYIWYKLYDNIIRPILTFLPKLTYPDIIGVFIFIVYTRYIIDIHSLERISTLPDRTERRIEEENNKRAK